MAERFGNTNRVIRSRNSKKDRKHNGHKEKDNQRSTKHTQKTKYWATRTPLKTGGEFRCPGRVRSSWYSCYYSIHLVCCV